MNTRDTRHRLASQNEYAPPVPGDTGKAGSSARTVAGPTKNFTSCTPAADAATPSSAGPFGCGRAATNTSAGCPTRPQQPQAHPHASISICASPSVGDASRSACPGAHRATVPAPPPGAGCLMSAMPALRARSWSRSPVVVLTASGHSLATIFAMVFQSRAVASDAEPLLEARIRQGHRLDAIEESKRMPRHPRSRWRSGLWSSPSSASTASGSGSCERRDHKVARRVGHDFEATDCAQAPLERTCFAVRTTRGNVDVELVAKQPPHRASDLVGTVLLGGNDHVAALQDEVATSR